MTNPLLHLSPRRIVTVLITVLILFSISPLAMSQGARRIARIEIEGLNRLTSENVIAMSGLKVGETFSVSSLDAAAQHLVDSGLFKNVGYRTKTMGSAVTVTFQVEENKSNDSPVVFDNFIWFSDEELTAVVQKVM